MIEVVAVLIGFVSNVKCFGFSVASVVAFICKTSDFLRISSHFVNVIRKVYVDDVFKVDLN